MPILLAVPSSHQIRPNSDQIELTRRRPSVEGGRAGRGPLNGSLSPLPPFSPSFLSLLPSDLRKAHFVRSRRSCHECDDVGVRLGAFIPFERIATSPRSLRTTPANPAETFQRPSVSLKELSEQRWRHRRHSSSLASHYTELAIIQSRDKLEAASISSLPGSWPPGWLAGKLQSSLARCRADGRVDGNKSGIANGGLRPLKMTQIIEIETWLFGLFGTLLCDFAMVRRRIAKSYVRIRPLTHSCRRGCAVGRSYYVVIRSQSAGGRGRGQRLRCGCTWGSGRRERGPRNGKGEREAIM